VSEPKRLDLTAEVERLAAIAKSKSDLAQPPLAPVPTPGYTAEDHERAMEEHRRLTQMSTWVGSIPRRFLDARPADFQEESEETRAQLTDWVKDPAGRNLLFLGPVGTGKTHAAVAAARVRYFSNNERPRFWPVVELLDALRPGGSEDAMEEAMHARLLILDDLGAEKPTEWTAERMYAVINRRWMNENVTIATSNLPATRKSAPNDYTDATLDEVLGPRMFSRLVGSGAVIIRLSGPDRRR
jgi:DNA replication protein DnaC